MSYHAIAAASDRACMRFTRLLKCLRQMCPVNGSLALLDEQVVTAGEMMTAEEPAISWQRWWM